MSRGEGCVEIVITMVSLANLQMQSCRCDDVENILMVRVVRGKSVEPTKDTKGWSTFTGDAHPH